MLLSANEIRIYSECARKRYYASRSYLAIKTAKDSGKFLLGKKVHEMLQYYYTGKGLKESNPFQLKQMEKDALERVGELKTFETLHELYYPNIIADRAVYEVLGCEHEFRLEDWPIAGVTYHGQIDMIVRRISDGAILFFEHKTCKDFRPEIYNRFDIQLHIYSAYGVRYAQQAGATWGGMVLNEIKKAKTERGYADHRMYYHYSETEERDFCNWLLYKTVGATDELNMHEPCNSYMVCKMCEYAPVCLAYGYQLPISHLEIIENDSMVDEETGEALYKYDPRASKEASEEEQ